MVFSIFPNTPLNSRLDLVGGCLPNKYFEPSTRLLSIASRSDHYFSTAFLRLMIQVKRGHLAGFSISLSRHLSQEITSPDQHRCHHRSKVEMITRPSSLFSSIKGRDDHQTIFFVLIDHRQTLSTSRHGSKVEMITRPSSLFSSITDRHCQQFILHIITYDR